MDLQLHMMPPPPRLQPGIVIIEQPKQRGMRFRYECEGRSAGSIPGENTTQERRTWPAIQILHYTGNVTVRVSLVSKDNPPRPHPHSLVGKDCNKGICSVTVNAETQMTAIFSNLGIQCVKRREVADALRLRQSLNVDPFNTDPQAVDIDLNIVRLCFEAFISQGNSHLVLQPVVSNPIFDKKATSSAMLRICKVDRSFGGCKGGDEVYLLCDKVQKDDISICFFELESNWEAQGEFSPTDVHRQVAVVFRTPPYRDTNITEATKVVFHLKRSSDGETSDSREFTYLPSQHGPTCIWHPCASHFVCTEDQAKALSYHPPETSASSQPQMRQNSDHATKRRYDENQTTAKRILREQLLRFTPKQDPGYYNRPAGDGGNTMSQSQQLRYSTRPFPSPNPPAQSTLDNSILSNNLQRPFASSRMPRMEQPQHNMFPQSGGYWPPSVMQRQTQPMAVTHHNFAPSQRQTQPMAVTRQNFDPSQRQTQPMAVTRQNFAPSQRQTQPMAVTLQNFAPPQQQTQPMAVTRQNFAPSITNATPMHSSSIPRGAMAQSPGPQPLHMTSYAPPIANTIYMASSSMVQQGAIALSPCPPQTTDLPELDAADLSFGDPEKLCSGDLLGKVMHNLSIDPGTGTAFSLIKTEQELAMPIQSADYFNDQQGPNVNIQAPSPQQVNSPAQYAANAREMEQAGMITGLFPGYEIQDDDHLPSYDLGSQLPSASQNELEDLVED